MSNTDWIRYHGKPPFLVPIPLISDTKLPVKLIFLLEKSNDISIIQRFGAKMRVDGTVPVRPESTFFADHSATLVAATILAAIGASLISNAAGPIGSALWGRISDVATAGAVLLFLSVM